MNVNFFWQPGYPSLGPWLCVLPFRIVCLEQSSRLSKYCFDLRLKAYLIQPLVVKGGLMCLPVLSKPAVLFLRLGLLGSLSGFRSRHRRGLDRRGDNRGLFDHRRQLNGRHLTDGGYGLLHSSRCGRRDF